MRREREKKTTPLIIAVMILTILCAAVYGMFTSHKITEESENHLHEIYSQVNNTFLSTLYRNDSMLFDARVFIEDLVARGDEAALHSYIQQGKQVWGYTDFYFMDYEGNYIRLDDKQGTFDLESENQLLIRNGKGVIKNIKKDDVMHTIFAVPIAQNTYHGFDYTAIAVRYDGHDMEAVLNISAYKDLADCYVIYPDGRIVFAAHADSSLPENYLTYLEENAKFQTGSLQELERGLKGNVNDIFEVRIDGENYYLIFQNVDMRDWSLVGLVPQSAVNGSMSQIQWVTIVVLGILFILIGSAVLIFFLRRNKRSLRQKNMELKYQKQMFEIVANSVTDVFVMFSVDDFTVEYVSPNCETLLGVSPDEIKADIRRMTATAVRPEKDPSIEEMEEVKVGESFSLTRERIHQKTGGRRWFQETVYRRLVDETEKFVLIMSERTQEVQGRRQLEQTLELAQSATKAKSVFLSNMSHDIRTPMNAIIGFSNLLKADMDNPKKVKEYVRKITASSQHLLGLINDVLDISKIESGKTTLTVSEFEIGQLVEDVDAVIRAQVKAKRQAFDVRVRGVKEDRLIGDQTRINQILINILSNAVKYTPEGGRIEMNITQRDHSSDKIAHLRFQIRDNGIGMSEEYLEVLFDSFTREYDTTTSGIQGTGLGMAITKNLVDLMGGTITVDSKKGIGTTFTVDLDLRIVDSEADKGFWKENNVTKILAVDDDADVCREIEQAMSKTGATVMGATNGYTALQMIDDAKKAGEPYDLILMDWKIPGIDGVETSRRIRSDMGDDTLILMLTSSDWDAVEDAARDAGVDAFMSKPFFAANLRYVLQQLKNKQTSGEISSDAIGSVLKGLRILGVEDNELNAEIMYELLEAEGAECELAENGEIGVAKFMDSVPGYYDAILMDIQMPVMDGYTATRTIRQSEHPEAKRIPIIALTANAFSEDVHKALDAGMNAHIAKPVDMDIVKKTLAQLLDKKNF